MKSLEKNLFFDINKFPQEKGLLIFGLSMSKLQNRQSAEKCIEDLKCFSNKIVKPSVELKKLK